MKRFLLFAAMAATLAVSCTKSELAPVSRDNAISFQTANYSGTKVEGNYFPTDETFSVFAWTEGTTGEYFMNNVTVAYNSDDNLWKPSKTYYWPGNNQGVDFFGYYPSGMSGLSVAQNRIQYSNINFANTQIDMLYSDKAVAYTGNENNYGHTGVPILFRHAGAKLTVYATLGLDRVRDTTTHTTTRWEVDLKGANLSGIYTTGSCVLDLASSPAKGLVSWVKPADAGGYNVWDHTSAVNSNLDSKYSNTRHYEMKNGESQEVIKSFYVLPQTLVADQQKINLTLTVRTYSQADGEEETLVMENDIQASADLLCEAIPAWQMNHSAVYTIVINPTGSYQPQPIFFDPYVVKWDTVENTIQIDLNLN